MTESSICEFRVIERHVTADGDALKAALLSNDPQDKAVYKRLSAKISVRRVWLSDLVRLSFGKKQRREAKQSNGEVYSGYDFYEVELETTDGKSEHFICWNAPNFNINWRGKIGKSELSDVAKTTFLTEAQSKEKAPSKVSAKPDVAEPKVDENIARKSGGKKPTIVDSERLVSDLEAILEKDIFGKTKVERLDTGEIVMIDLSYNKKITIALLTRIGALTSLEDLNLRGTHITDAGLEKLSGLSSLKSLKLGRTHITDMGLKHVRGMKALRDLELEGTGVTDAGLDRIVQLEELTHLNLDDTSVTGACLQRLRTLRKLDWLEIDGTEISDKDINQLKSLKIRAIWVGKNQFSPKVVEELKESLPGLRVSTID